MTTAALRKATRRKVQAHRDKRRAQGMRLIQIWVPDTRHPGFAAEARRQSLAAARSKTAKEDQAFVDAVSVGYDD